MKKIIALVLTVAVLFSISMVAFAVSSPAADQYSVIKIRKGNPVEGAIAEDVWFDVTDGTVKVKADPKYGTFNSWSFFKYTAAEGSNPEKVVPAVAGVDYVFISGSDKSSEITFKINTDVIVCGNYSGLITDPLKTSDQPGTKSPKTGDMAVAYASFVMLLGVAGVFATKKVFAK